MDYWEAPRKGSLRPTLATIQGRGFLCSPLASSRTARTAGKIVPRVPGRVIPVGPEIFSARTVDDVDVRHDTVRPGDGILVNPGLDGTDGDRRGRRHWNDRGSRSYAEVKPGLRRIG